MVHPFLSLKCTSLVLMWERCSPARPCCCLLLGVDMQLFQSAAGSGCPLGLFLGFGSLVLSCNLGDGVSLATCISIQAVGKRDDEDVYSNLGVNLHDTFVPLTVFSLWMERAVNLVEKQLLIWYIHILFTPLCPVAGLLHYPRQG
jgi:hypothetical protein